MRKNNSRLFKVQRQNDKSVFRTVDLLKRTCSCGFYEEYGIPCRHLCAACLLLGDHPQSLVIRERTLAALQTMYSGETVPVDVTLLNNNGLKAPTHTKKRGHPIETRFVSPAEKKPRRTVTCSICHQKGHNSRTCKSKTN